MMFGSIAPVNGLRVDALRARRVLASALSKDLFSLADRYVLVGITQIGYDLLVGWHRMIGVR